MINRVLQKTGSGLQHKEAAEMLRRMTLHTRVMIALLGILE
jgi:hypothetical protein